MYMVIRVYNTVKACYLPPSIAIDHHQSPSLQILLFSLLQLICHINQGYSLIFSYCYPSESQQMPISPLMYLFVNHLMLYNLVGPNGRGI